MSSVPESEEYSQELRWLDGLPDELASLNQWICWRSAEGGSNSAIDPIDPTTGRVLTSPDGTDGVALDEAKDYVERSLSDADGVALVVTSDDPYVGIRLVESVRVNDGNPEVEDLAGRIVEEIDSYTEAGPSESSILTLAKATLPEVEFQSDKMEFTSDGVLPVTGHTFDGYSDVNQRHDRVCSVFEEYNEIKPEFDESITLSDVRDTVIEEFDEQMWGVTEALLSAHATLLIEEVRNCTGVIIVGESGAGKTTAIRFFEGLDDQIYRSDDATPASFVSHDASLTDEQLESVDLLPRIRHKTLTCRDMATWFSGPYESIRQKMALMAHLMDGDGYTRDSGSHGQRGYQGDYRFTFIGATTPLDPRAWRVMGHTGYRFVFYNLPSDDVSRDELADELFSETRYPERVDLCRDVVHNFLKKLWTEHDGYGGVEEHFGASDEAKEAISYLAQVVKFSRATLGNDDEPSQESPERVGAVLRDLAQGRALLDGRTTIQVDDVQVSARIALSTMPAKRRPLVRALLDPRNDGQLTRQEVQAVLDVSKPTAIDRMMLMDTLGIAEYTEVEGDDRGTKRLELRDEFKWPDSLIFPER